VAYSESPAQPRVALASLLNASQIAELAEVGPSAVSNWRKRFDDFPEPVHKDPGGRDLFELGGIEAWLKKHDRLQGERRSKQLLWSAADLLRGSVPADATLEVLGAALGLVALRRRQGGGGAQGEDVGSMLAAAVAMDPTVDDLLRPLNGLRRQTADRLLSLIGAIEEAELLESFEWLLRRSQDSVEHQSSDAQAALLLALVGEEAETIYDPAAGSGAFLGALWQSVGTGGRPGLYGQEIDPRISRIARQRFLIGDIPASMATGDTLVNDRRPDLRADVVVCDPPYGVRKSWPASATGDPRWLAGRPPAVTDFAWLQQALHHLAADGRAYVFLPLGSLRKGGRERDLRRELLIEGAVEAVVSLPPRTASGTSIPLALWILCPPGSSPNRNRVLLVDAAASVAPHRPVLDTLPVQRIAETVRAWRAGMGVREKDRDLAVAPPVLDLLGRDATLVPARWMTGELTATQREGQEADFEEAMNRIREAHETLGSEIALTVPPAKQSPPVWTPVSRLAEDGLVSVVSGTRVRTDDYRPSGLPVLRPRDVAAGFADRVEPCFVEVDATKTSAGLTRPGDVVLAPIGEGLGAAVDYAGGHLLAQPLQALRLMEGFLDPEVVAAFLQVPRNQRLMTGPGRLSLRDLELPVLTPRESRDLRASLDELNAQESLADGLKSSVRRLRQALLSLASSAAIGEGGE
jgi:N-6 DNA Methylase